VSHIDRDVALNNIRRYIYDLFEGQEDVEGTEKT